MLASDSACFALSDSTVLFSFSIVELRSGLTTAFLTASTIAEMSGVDAAGVGVAGGAAVSLLVSASEISVSVAVSDNPRALAKNLESSITGVLVSDFQMLKTHSGF